MILLSWHHSQGAHYQVFINAKHVASFKSRSKDPVAELAQIKHFVVRTGFEIVGFNIPPAFVPGAIDKNVTASATLDCQLIFWMHSPCCVCRRNPKQGIGLPAFEAGTRRPNMSISTCCIKIAHTTSSLAF